MDTINTNLTLSNIGDFLSKFTEHSDHIYWISSPDMKKIQYISPSYEQIWGRSRQELYDNPEIWITFLHPDDVVNHHPIHEMAEKIARLGDKARYAENYRIIRPDGEVRWIMDNGFPIYNDNGDCVGISGIAVDITAMKKIENELIEEKEKVNEAFIAMANAEEATVISKTKADAEEEMRKTVMVLVGDIVHDLRTPIATIRTVADILDMMLPILLEIADEAKTLGAEKVKLLNKKKWAYLAEKTPTTSIQSSVVLIDSFINSTLIELSNAQSIELDKKCLTKCSSRRIIENTLEAYPFSDKSIIKQNVGYDFFLMGNSILTMKILFNLIKNALEQINLNGKGNITITTEETQDWNLLKVMDTAGGAPPDVVANLFKGYFTTKKNGTGIGLAFCKRVMDSFGGDIICHSIVGDSMEFVLKFPKVID